MFLLYIILIFIIIYLFNITRFIIGINKYYKIPSNKKKLFPISVIVAVKNGEKNIKRLLDGLSSQIYKGTLEFLIVDDNSTDNTKKIITEYINNDSRFKYITSNQGAKFLNHKKRALDAGIRAANYEYLLFTDIDCIIQSNWAASMASCFCQNIDYIVGLTYLNDRKTILNKFQGVDLFMLLFASYSSIVLHKPWACSGQNQAYTKTLYNNLGGFKLISQYLQGDDTLFLQIAVKNGANIIFNYSPDAYVISRTEQSWKNLFLQRARWAGDANVMWKFNFYFYLMVLATFIINISIILLLFTPYFKLSLIIILLKLFFEIRMYRLGMLKFKHKINYQDFIIWFLIVPIYTIFMGILSFFNFKWRKEHL